MIGIHHHRGSQVLVGHVRVRVVGRAVCGDVRHPVERRELGQALVLALIVVVYLPPAGKRNFFQPSVRGRAARQAVGPGVGDVGVRVGGGAVQRGLSAARPQFNLYGVPGYLVSPDIVSPDIRPGRPRRPQRRAAAI